MSRKHTPLRRARGCLPVSSAKHPNTKLLKFTSLKRTPFVKTKNSLPAHSDLRQTQQATSLKRTPFVKTKNSLPAHSDLRQTHQATSLKRKPFVKTKNPLHDTKLLQVAPNSGSHIFKQLKTLCLTANNSELRQTRQATSLNQKPCETKNPLPDVPQLRIAPNSASHIFLNENLVKPEALCMTPSFSRLR